MTNKTEKKQVHVRISYAEVYQITEKLKIYKNEIVTKKMTYEQVAKMISEDLKGAKAITAHAIKKCWKIVFPETPFPRQPIVKKERKPKERKVYSGGSVYRKLKRSHEISKIISEGLIKLMAALGLHEDIKAFQTELINAEIRYKSGWINQKEVTP